MLPTVPSTSKNSQHVPKAFGRFMIVVPEQGLRYSKILAVP